MEPRIWNGYYKHLRIEDGWQLGICVLDVTLADTADAALFVAFDVRSRKPICSSPHKDGFSALIDILSHAIHKHGAPSQFICESSLEFHSLIFERWALLRNIPLYFLPPELLVTREASRMTTESEVVLLCRC
jgi:hypothetical protein